MGNLGGGEILIILLAALLFLGPQKLPEAARQIGKAMAEFRKMTTGFQREIRDAISDDSTVEAQARARGDALVAQEATAAAEREVNQPNPDSTTPVETPAPTSEAVLPPSGDR